MTGETTPQQYGQGGAQVTALAQLGRVSRLYESLTVEYRDVCKEAAETEADYRRMKAVFITRATADGMAVGKAEYAADADKEVAAACMAYKLAAGLAEAAKQRLIQLREQVATGRSVLVTDRESDRIATTNIAGRA